MLIRIIFLISITFLSHGVAKLPKSFSLKEIGKITPAKEQAWGTCWAFATMSSIESAMLVEGAKYIPDLSEYHADKYSGFTRKGSNLHLKNDWYSGQGENYLGSNSDDLNSGLIVHLGGDYRMATAYLSHNGGAVNESSTPKVKTHSDHESFSKIKLKNDYQYYLPHKIEWLQNKKEIKEAIMKYGAVASSQKMSKKPLAFHKGLEVHGYFKKEKLDHAISLIGWDDNIKFKKHKGAWLVKDSDHKDDQGKHIKYFYILYDDVHTAKDKYMGAVVFRDIRKNQSDFIYSHALHGWRYTSHKNDNIKKVKVQYQAKRDELIDKISFYTTSKNEKINITLGEYFYKNTFKNPGFQIIEPKQVIKLKKNQNFSIEFETSSGQYAYDASFTMDVAMSPLPEWGKPVDVNSKASKNEVFYFQDGKWKDFAKFKSRHNKQLSNKHAKENDTASIPINIFTSSALPQ